MTGDRIYDRAKAIAIGCLTFCGFTFCQALAAAIIAQSMYGQAAVRAWQMDHVGLDVIWWAIAIVGMIACEVAFQQGKHLLRAQVDPNHNNS